MISCQQVFFFLATWWAGYFFFLLNALQNIFFPSSFLCRIFFPQKSVMCYIYRMYSHLHCGYRCNSSIWSCKALKCCKLITKSCHTKACFQKVTLYTHLILRHNISDAPQVDLKMFSFLFKKKQKAVQKCS